LASEPHVSLSAAPSDGDHVKLHVIGHMVV
jgi:hypothetical protein